MVIQQRINIGISQQVIIDYQQYKVQMKEFRYLGYKYIRIISMFQQIIMANQIQYNYIKLPKQIYSINRLKSKYISNSIIFEENDNQNKFIPTNKVDQRINYKFVIQEEDIKQNYLELIIIHE
ncbi:unnamed protein product [Paramecium sonneborni]|uniref:Uncharacterized protein n=1 Tax=Paramecium sonneborni TaxID=65129 RepID=A0A8S1Q354_9CILI|nr:unnamed protein product [Paramecium sonneborni]